MYIVLFCDDFFFPAHFARIWCAPSIWMLLPRLSRFSTLPTPNEGSQVLVSITIPLATIISVSQISFTRISIFDSIHFCLESVHEKNKNFIFTEDVEKSNSSSPPRRAFEFMILYVDRWLTSFWLTPRLPPPTHSVSFEFFPYLCF